MTKCSGLCHLFWDPVHSYTPQQAMWAQVLIQGQGGESGMAVATRSRWSPTGFAEADSILSWCSCCRAHCRLDHIMLLLSCASAGHWLDVCISPSWESWLQTLCHILDPYCEDRTGFVHNFFFHHIKSYQCEVILPSFVEKKNKLWNFWVFLRKLRKCRFVPKLHFIKSRPWAKDKISVYHSNKLISLST